MGMGYDAFFDAMTGTRMMNGALGAVAGVLVGVMIIAALIGFAISIVTYVLYSLSCYTIAKRRGIHHPWLAWIPVGNSWILGSISDQYQYVAKGKVRNRRKALLGLAIASIAISVPVSIAEAVIGVQSAMGYGKEAMSISVVIGICSAVMAILSVISAVIQYIAYYDLFNSCEPRNSVLYLVLGIVISITMPIFLFICRNKDEGMPPRRQQRPQVYEEPQLEEIVEDDLVTDEDFEA